MEKEIIQQIKDNILASNPSTFVKGYSTLRQLNNGKIVQWVNDEGEVVGLTDNKYNYFYIRYRDEVTTDEPTDRTTSCHEYEVSAPLRLVAWVNNGNETRLKDVLIYDMSNTDYSGVSDALFTKIYPIRIEEIILNKERISIEETLKEAAEIKLKKNVTLIAIDFILRFNHKPFKHEECLDRDICVGCT